MKPDEAGCTTLNWEIQSLTAGVPGEVATQMGNRGYSTDAIRVAREMVWAGEIGDVTEVHAWHGGAVGALEIASGRRGRGRSGINTARGHIKAGAFDGFQFGTRSARIRARLPSWPFAN